MALITPPILRPSSIDELTCASPTSSSIASCTAEDGFHQLVSDLSIALESSSGRTIADVDPAKIVRRMGEYVSKEEEWSRYAFEDRSRAYTRNLVDAGNGKSNLLVLVWTPGKSSPIHDHADAHCVMKVLKGRLKESRFEWPNSEGPQPLRLSQEKILQTGQVAYMSDELGLHCISNPDTSEIAVSLHLYTPPNAAKHGCDIFDRKTGRSSHVQQCHFFSEYGVRQ